MATNIFVLMDWRGRAFGHHSRNGGGRGICQQKLPAGPGICPIFSNARGLPGGLPGGMLAAGIDSHITRASAGNVLIKNG